MSSVGTLLVAINQAPEYRMLIKYENGHYYLVTSITDSSTGLITRRIETLLNLTITDQNTRMENIATLHNVIATLVRCSLGGALQMDILD